MIYHIKDYSMNHKINAVPYGRMVYRWYYN
jgi:hypothetical protein